MKLFPYTRFDAAIPAMALVAVNVTHLLGPAAQLAAVLLVLLVAARCFKAEVSTSWVLVAYLAVCILVGIAAFGPNEAVVKAGKLALFALVSILTVRGSRHDNTFPALVALRAFLLICGANLLFALATGSEVFRGAYLIEFSIYSSYTIAILLYIARDRLTIADRLAAYSFSILCGSTMGLLLLFLAEILGRRIRPRFIAATALGAPIALALLLALFEARGKELTWEFLAQSDRGMILSAFFQTTLSEFDVSNLLFGLGVGSPLHQFATPDPHFNHYLTRLGDGAIYSFCLHNEPLRVLCDFGLVGLLLVCLRLFSYCTTPVLLLLGICMVTNSYLYSFSGALVASGLFNVKPEKTRVPV
ncbi:MAG: hypothetical protein AAGJ79_03300 [Verrucomicrobiota bacterium]